MNGVTHSLLKILQHLKQRGDEVLVIAPSTLADAPAVVEGAAVWRLPAVPVAGYRNVRVAVGGVARVRAVLAEFGPDIVHLASPFVLGWRAVRAAQQLGVPTVAVYQTDVPGYAAKYGMPLLENWAWNRVERIHLAPTGRWPRPPKPSTSSAATAFPAWNFGAVEWTPGGFIPRSAVRNSADLWHPTTSSSLAMWGGWRWKNRWPTSLRFPTFPAPVWWWSATGRSVRH